MAKPKAEPGIMAFITQAYVPLFRRRRRTDLPAPLCLDLINSFHMCRCLEEGAGRISRRHSVWTWHLRYPPCIIPHYPKLLLRSLPVCSLLFPDNQRLRSACSVPLPQSWTGPDRPKKTALAPGHCVRPANSARIGTKQRPDSAPRGRSADPPLLCGAHRHHQTHP